MKLPTTKILKKLIYVGQSESPRHRRIQYFQFKGNFKGLILKVRHILLIEF